MKFFACTIALCADSANSQTFTTLVRFTGTGGTASGSNTYGCLTLGRTTLYGMTAEGRSAGAGNIFRAGIDGSGYQELYDFTGGGDPLGDLTLSGGTLFGITGAGGDANGDGTVFVLAVPAAPAPEPRTLAPRRLRVFRIAGGGGGFGNRVVMFDDSVTVNTY